MPEIISRYVLFFVVVISVLAGVFLEETFWHPVQQPEQPKTYSSESQNVPTSEADNGDDAIPSVKLIPPVKSEQEAAEDANEKNEKRWNDRITLAIGFATAFILFLQLFVFGVQAYMLRRTINKMDEVARGQTNDMACSIAEAKRAATAMGNVAISLAKNVEITEQIIARQKMYAQIQLRAYVAPHEAGLWDGTTTTPARLEMRNVPGIGVNFRNSGHTPAKDVVSWANIEIGTAADENNLIVPELEHGFPANLSPGGIMPKSLWYNRALTEEEIADIRSGVRSIYLYGRVEYLDCFKDKQWSNFRLKYSGRFPPIGGISFLHCDKGNESSD